MDLSPFSRRSSLAAYQSTAVHAGVAAADPHGLVLMLLDAAVDRLTTARGCIQRGETVRKAKLLHGCVMLVTELRGSLNMAQGGPLAQNLSDLYAYMIQQLLRANVANDATLVTEVLGLLGDIRSGWAAIAPAAASLPRQSAAAHAHE
jgi:flagellar protein FliS